MQKMDKSGGMELAKHGKEVSKGKCPMEHENSYFGGWYSHIGRETFLMTYGDNVCDVDIRKLVEFHRAHGTCATITAVRQKQQKGVLMDTKPERGLLEKLWEQGIHACSAGIRRKKCFQIIPIRCI